MSSGLIVTVLGVENLCLDVAVKTFVAFAMGAKLGFVLKTTVNIGRKANTKANEGNI